MYVKDCCQSDFSKWGPFRKTVPGVRINRSINGVSFYAGRFFTYGLYFFILKQ